MAAQNRNCKVKRLALMGLLFALAMALSFLESLLPALPMLPPGIRLGRSNIVSVYALVVQGPVSGYTIAVLKSLFVLLTRGAVAAAMSASGGIASVTVMLLLEFLGALPEVKYPAVVWPVIALGICVAVGTGINALLTRWYFRPMKQIIGAVRRVA